ncbi:pimeloyl-ACP methyl ester carboxylesterase [Paraburkholderia sp. EB58]|uniref:alpha/beta fold hydrolase n=1 Tax=Paraburkholderia sp. EB58 TaxID=3035125 RepID=UPI003D23B9C8
MPSQKSSFVFIHGAWHSNRTWDKVMPRLQAAGHACRAIDLPGAGTNARFPKSFYHRPLNPARFATEPSPNRAVTQAQRTEAVVDVVRQMTSEGNSKIVLVGHSLGGLTVSATAEAVPELLHRTVYLTGFMLPPGMSVVGVHHYEAMATALVPGLLMADPQAVGAQRIDVKSEASDYRAKLREAFYGDVEERELSAFQSSLHCDEPASVAVESSLVTPARYGRVKRHYLCCTEDRAIPLAGQEFMIAAVDEAIGMKTAVHRLEASHSPFLSMPEQLSEVLLEIAG